jgi:hypothetical protein
VLHRVAEDIFEMFQEVMLPSDDVVVKRLLPAEFHPAGFDLRVSAKSGPKIEYQLKVPLDG